MEEKNNPNKILNLECSQEEEFPDIPDEVEKINIRQSEFKEIIKLPKNLKWFDC